MKPSERRDLMNTLFGVPYDEQTVRLLSWRPWLSTNDEKKGEQIQEVGHVTRNYLTHGELYPCYKLRFQNLHDDTVYIELRSDGSIRSASIDTEGRIFKAEIDEYIKGVIRRHKVAEQAMDKFNSEAYDYAAG